MIVGPQVNFDDLYSAVYAVIDDAKTRHRVVKLYKGSHGSADPHPARLRRLLRRRASGCARLRLSGRSAIG